MAYSTFSHVEIAALSCVVPPKVISFDEEREFYPTERLFLRNKQILGLGTRHVVDNGITVCDLGEAAVKELIAQGEIEPSAVECLIVASCTHDYVYPASSCILQGRLALPESTLCFDMSGLSCSAYVHALLQGSALIESGAVKNCLIVCGDIASTDTDRRNHLTNILFGDAVSATFLRWTDTEKRSYFLTGTVGEGFDRIIAPAGGKAFPIRKDIASLEFTDERGNVWHLWEDIIDGMGVFEFSTRVGPSSLRELLERSGKSLEDIDFVAVHQANGQIVKTVCNQAGIPREKWSNATFSRYGNCASASVVTVLCNECRDKGQVLLCTFGIGLSYASAIVDLQHAHVHDISILDPVPRHLSREETISYWSERFLKGHVKEKH